MLYSNNHSRQTILIIDDNVVNLKVAIGSLEAYSYEILTARSGETGLARATLVEPDLILLDVQLPDINGFEVCRRLKASPTTAAIPVLFMTVRSETSDKVAGLEAGAVDFITKPIEVEELLARIRTHLTLRTLQERLESEVAARTAALTAEIEQRKQQQAEKERLLATLQMQSEQLRTLTRLLLEAEQERRSGVEQFLDSGVRQELRLLLTHLEAVRDIVAQATAGNELVPTIVGCIDQALAVINHVQQQAERVVQSINHDVVNQQNLLHSPLLNLSAREREVLQLLVDGMSNAEIALTLTVARGTVSTYRRRIMNKLDVDDLAGLVRLALQHKLVSLKPPN